jgi:RimJ/RimL family protein N-acetyltransferase
MIFESCKSREAPVLTTERLILRPHGLQDFRECAQMWADSDVARYTGGRSFTEEEVWVRMLRYAGHWALMGFGYWAVLERASGAFVGEAGFVDYKRNVHPSFQGCPEIGCALVTCAQHKGYAAEALGLAISWGDAHFGKTRTVGMMHPENVAVIRLSAKCGYQEFLRAPYRGRMMILVERRSPKTDPGAS